MNLDVEVEQLGEHTKTFGVALFKATTTKYGQAELEELVESSLDRAMHGDGY